MQSPSCSIVGSTLHFFFKIFSISTWSFSKFPFFRLLRFTFWTRVYLPFWQVLLGFFSENFLGPDLEIFLVTRLGENYGVYKKNRFDKSIIIYNLLILNSQYFKSPLRGGATWYPILVVVRLLYCPGSARLGDFSWDPTWRKLWGLQKKQI